jgi:hypothetical protein
MTLPYKHGHLVFKDIKKMQVKTQKVTTHYYSNLLPKASVTLVYMAYSSNSRHTRLQKPYSLRLRYTEVSA